MPYILIIDDVVEFRHAIAELLEYEGFEVAETNNSTDCFAEMKQRRPDLILIDLNFPCFESVNFINQVRCNFLFANIPIIAISSFSDTAHIKDALLAGVNEYLVKPFVVTKILDSIQNLIFQLLPVSDDPIAGENADFTFQNLLRHGARSDEQNEGGQDSTLPLQDTISGHAPKFSSFTGNLYSLINS